MNQTARPCDIIITNGRILDLDRPDGVLDDHAVVILDGRIADVVEASESDSRWRAARSIDARGGIVMPGFVEAHVHLSGFLAAAMPYHKPAGEGMFSGGCKVREIVPFIAEMTSMDLPDELTATVLRPVFAAMLRAGITSVVDAGSSGHSGLVAAADQAGIRAAIGPSLADRWHDDDGTVVQQADTGAILDSAGSWLESAFAGTSDRVRGLVSAVETIACSDALLSGIADLADSLDVPSNIHCHITEASDRAHVDAYGTTAISRLEASGMLTPRLTAMHVGSACDNDIDAFASGGVTANVNPLGNAMLGFATAGRQALPRLMDAGVPVVLGSDYAPSMTPNPFESMRAALSITREAVGTDIALSLESALEMATNGGASVGRPGELGRIVAGHLADVIVVDTSGPHHLGDRHPVPSVALRARSHDVEYVVVDGRLVVDAGVVMTLDVDEVTGVAQALLASLR